MTVVYRVVYVDDVAADREPYQAKLQRSGHLVVQAMAPSKDLELSAITEASPDLVLVDYELTRKDGRQGEHVNYRGTTLASAIKDELPDVPVVLFTRKSLVEERGKQLTDTFPLFDEVYFKGCVDRCPEKAGEDLAALARGFAELRSASRDWNGLLDALGATETELHDLRESRPPIDSGEWRVTSIAKWIQRCLLRFPGVLYNAVHAATALGISIESFEHQRVQEFLEPTKYNGVFSWKGGHWWKSRLFDSATSLAMEAGLDGSIRQSFRTAIKSLHGIDLSPAICNSSGKEGANAVCYILNEPVLVAESLAYRPDHRPQIMDEARVSFKAVRESNAVDEELLAPGALEIYRSMRR